MMITIRPVTRDNWRAAVALEVDPAQQRFVADHAPVALVGLAKAYVRPGGRLWLPYVFTDGEQPVGFVQLVHDKEPSEVWIYHFFIDRRHQGHGAGTAALQATLDHITTSHPGCRRVCLTVHPDNQVARRLYRRAGFRETGVDVESEPVYCLSLP